MMPDPSDGNVGFQLDHGERHTTVEVKDAVHSERCQTIEASLAIQIRILELSYRFSSDLLGLARSANPEHPQSCLSAQSFDEFQSKIKTGFVAHYGLDGTGNWHLEFNFEKISRLQPHARVE